MKSIIGALPTQAQIIPDTTLQDNSIVIFTDPIYFIGGGTQSGVNLFHSFEHFSLLTQQTAFFDNPLGIQNIITRVTGLEISNIDGLIRSTNPANLFLINPNGIIFGSNFSLNIGGSFLASTGSAIEFEEGRLFSTNTSESNSALLSINVPIGLQYNQNPGAIHIQDSSVDLNGHDLILVGGLITLDGASLETRGGRVELGSVDEFGTIGLDVNTNNIRLNFPDTLARSDVFLKNTSINVEFDDVRHTDAGVDGSISIFGRNVKVESSEMNAGIGDISLNTLASAAEQNQIDLWFFWRSKPRTLADYKLIFTGISGLASDGMQGGDITIDATEAISIVDESTLTNRTGLYAPGNSGNIYIRSGLLSVIDDSRIQTVSDDKGNAGNIFVESKGDILLDNSYVGSQVTDVFSDANTGDIDFRSHSLYANNGSLLEIRRNSSGILGNITLKIPDRLDFANQSGVYIAIGESRVGRATNDRGNINIETNSLRVSNGSFIQTFIGVQSPNNTADNTGNINITASDAISLEKNSLIASEVFGEVNSVGTIRLNSRFLSLMQGSQIRTNSEVLPDIVPIPIPDPDPEKNSGLANIEINANESVTLSGINTGLFAKIALGNGGNITVNSPELLIENNAILDTQSSNGFGGDITIDGNNLNIKNGGQIVTNTSGNQSAGDILINVSDRINLQNVNSGVFANTNAESTGSGGNILINGSPNQINILDGATIAANSNGSGNAGNIQLQTNFLNLNGTGFLLTEAATGEGGNINVQAGTLQLRNNSGISTTAGRAGAGGNGGNITIDARTIAGLENSDIAANAFDGSGGKITINADAIFGLQEISSQDLQNRLGTDDLTQFENPNQLLESSDIVAISQTNPNLSGEIVFNIQNPNPTSGLLELATNIVDVNALINQDPCIQGADSEFIVTGSGGLPAGVRDSLSGDAIWPDIRSPMRQAREFQEPIATVASSTPIEPIIEATDWVLGSDGQIILVAEPANAAVNGWQAAPACQRRNNR